MEKRAPRRERSVRAAVALVAALMLWSVIGSMGGTVAQEAAVTEPEDLSAYATSADAAPVQMYFDHQLRLIPLGPAIAHSTSNVALPSQASAISWLVDFGVANGLHGTSTGNRVPTEASAQAPGGDPESEFHVAGGPIGAPSFGGVRAGRAYAKADHSDTPTGYGNAFLANLFLLPAAGAAGDDPPGTFDPNAAAPNQDAQPPDPQPQGQMAILSIGKIASTSRSVRDGSTIRSIGVAELHDINIGNRTSDNRCTNCIRIDFIRAEAFAEATGQKGGASAAYRVTGGRMCRRGFDAETGQEQDRCIPLDPRDHESTKGLQSIDEFEQLNEQFEKPFWTTISDGAIDYTVGLRIHAGSTYCEQSRARRTPKDEPCRNQATPQRGKADPSNGEVAKAVAEAIDLEITTITTSQAGADAVRRLEGTPAAELLRAIDQDTSQPGTQLCGPGDLCGVTGQQTVPTDSVLSVRRVQVALGVAKATAVARGVTPAAAVDLGGGVTAPDVSTGPLPGGGATVGGDAGVGAPAGGGIGGPLKLRINWASFKVRPWPPYDMAKGMAIAAMVFGIAWLLRRRLRPTP